MQIGVRSGKIHSGLYKCGNYRIELKKGYWWVYKYYGTDAEYCVYQATSLSKAYDWGRRNPNG